MAVPVRGDLIFEGGARIGGLPPAVANGQAATYEQIPAGVLLPGATYASGSDITLAMTSIAPVTVVATAATIRAFPWRILKQVSITALRIEVTTLQAGATCRVGLYSDNGSGYPNALLGGSDVAAFDCATAGVKGPNTFPAAIVLASGLYWVAINHSGTPTLRVISPAAVDPILGVNLAGGTTPQYTAWGAALAFGPLPATFPGGAARVANAAPPFAMFRVT